MGRKRRYWWLLLLLIIPLVLAGAALFLLFPRPHRPVVSALKPGPTGTINILIIGKDARALEPVQHEGRQRNLREKQSHSDVVMVVHVNLDLGRVNLLALPRDLLVGVPGVTRAESATDFNQMEKLTHAYIIGGEKLLGRTVEHLLGITIHRMVALDFDSFRMAFGLLRPFLGNLKVAGVSLSNRHEALKFVRRRYGLAQDDIDRCRNNLLFVRSVINRVWWLADTRLGGLFIKRVLQMVGDDTDLTVEEIGQVVYGLKQAGFSPARIQTAVLVGEGIMVTLERYGETLWCYLPAYREIRKQADRFLRDQDTVSALDFMTRQKFSAPGYLFENYVTGLPAESPPDSSALATRLMEMERLGMQPQPDSGR